MLSPQSRTKVNADHAGHSLPLVPLKVSTRSLQVTSSPSQNNNWLTAQLPAMVAMVVSWYMLSNMLNKTPLKENPTTHTLLKPKAANTTDQRVLSKLNKSSKFLKTTMLNSRLLSTRDPYQSLLKLIKLSSNTITVVLSAQDAAPKLTTVFWLLVMAMDTGSSRTLGAHHGENRVTLESLIKPELDNAVSTLVLNMLPPTENEISD